MKIQDYRIEERFDFDEMCRYFVIQRYSIIQQEYALYSPKRFSELIQAKAAVNMLRKYQKPIFHYDMDNIK